MADETPGPRTLAEAAEAAGVALSSACAPEDAVRVARKVLVRLRAHGAPESAAAALTWDVGDATATISVYDLGPAAGYRAEAVVTQAGPAPARKRKG